MQNLLLPTILLPVLYQLIWGFKAVYHPSKVSLGVVGAISLIAHIVLSYINIQIVSSKLTADSLRRGIPIVPVVSICIVLFIFLFVVIGIQYFVSWWMWRPSKKTFDN